MSKHGMLIALDGTDGSGKGTQTTLLCNELEKRGIPFRHLDFPTYHADWSRLVKLYLDGGFGSNPDSVNAYAASSFFAADRYCSYMLDWKRDYDDGKIIVANRYTTGNAVHQLSKLPESEYDSFLAWLSDYEHCKLGLPAPDLVLYLALPPEYSIKLIEKRCAETGAVKDIHESSIRHLTAASKAAAYACGKSGWHRIDCCDFRGEMRGIDDIHAEIMAVTAKPLAEHTKKDG